MVATTFTFETAKFVPIAIGFFGLSVGYLTWGGYAFFGWPRIDATLPGSELAINRSLGLWGIWMPGFMQFLTGVYLAVGLTWFKVFDEKPLMMAALAFTAYGVHWFVLGYRRYVMASTGPDAFMALAYAALSILGALVFWHADDLPVFGLFVGLTLVYLTEIPTRFERFPAGEKLVGFWQLATGGWLLYLTFGVILEATNGWNVLF
ncbi:MAG: hypothetical protein QOE13_2107 [Gaiellaceae bacterium]|jgi:hypothetical protein|nr:hypothetical protein [Gaiellaceae bacterium]